MGTRKRKAVPGSKIDTKSYEGYQYRLDGVDREILDLDGDELLRCLKHAIDAMERVDEIHDDLRKAIQDWRQGT